MNATTTPNASPLASLSAAEAVLVRQLHQVADRLDAVATTAIDAALARLRESAERARARLIAAARAVSATAGDVLGLLEDAAAGIGEDLLADAGIFPPAGDAAANGVGPADAPTSQPAHEPTRQPEAAPQPAAVTSHSAAQPGAGSTPDADETVDLAEELPAAPARQPGRPAAGYDANDPGDVCDLTESGTAPAAGEVAAVAANGPALPPAVAPRRRRSNRR